MADNILSGIDSGISSNILLAKFISDNSIPLIILKSNVLKKLLPKSRNFKPLVDTSTKDDDGGGDDDDGSGD